MDLNVWRLIPHHEKDDTRRRDVIGWSIREGLIIIGWGKMGSLENHLPGSSDEITNLIERYDPGKTNKYQGGRSLWRFYKGGLKQGDLVILGGYPWPAYNCVMQVAGDYQFHTEPLFDGYQHIRKAKLIVGLNAHRLWDLANGIDPEQITYDALVKCHCQVPYNVMPR